MPVLRRLALLALGAVLAGGSPVVAGPPPPPEDPRALPITVEIVPARTYAVAHRTGPYAGLAADYGRILAWMRAGGLAVGGPAEGWYQDDPLSVAPEKLRSTAAFPVAEPLPERPPTSADGISLLRLPARLVARTIHVGPYAEVRPAYDRLRRALPSLALGFLGPMREVYVDDPAVTAPTGLRTDVGLVCEPSAKTDVGVYVGPGADGEGLRSVSQALFADGISFRALGPEAFRGAPLRKACRGVLVPGGWSPAAAEALGAEGLAAIRELVRTGGGYVGICAGAYLESRALAWEGTRAEQPWALFEGSATGPVAGLAPWPQRARVALAIEGTHPIVRGLVGARTVLYHGGPVLAPDAEGVAVLARFAQGGGAAVVAFGAGQGRVVLSSVHLEGLPSGGAAGAGGAPSDLAADPESDRDLLARAVRWAVAK